MKNDELIDTVYKSLEKSIGDRQPLYRLSDDLSPTNVKNFISTGCAPLDVALANRRGGGFALGRLSQIQGKRSTGKSLLLATALANAQKQGYITALFDNEYAVDESFYRAIGLDTEKLIYGNIEYVEDVLMAIEDIIMNISKSKNNTPVVIGIDSIAGLKSKEEIEKDYDKGGYNTHKAIILSQKLPKILPLLAKHKVALICTQQLRANVGVTFGPSTVPASGGKAIGYFTSQIVKLRSAGKIKSKDGLIVGVKTKAQVTKNRLGPPYRTAEFEIYFDSGIDDYKSCLDILNTYNVVKGRAWKYFTEDLGIDGIDLELEKEKDNGEKVYGPKFRTKKWREWMDDPNVYDAIVEKIAELNIMKYKGHMEDDDTQIVSDKEDEEQMDDDSRNKIDQSK